MALALVGAAIFAGVASAADGILDQSSTTIDNPSAALVSSWHSSVTTQTFTVVASGQLTDVQIPIWTDFSSYAGSIRMVVHPAPGGVVDAGVTLATASVAASSLPTNDTPVTWTDFAFSTPPLLVAGSQYAIRVDELSADHQHFWWQGSQSNVYAGGQPSGTLIFPAGGDVAFQTFLIPSAPPSVGGGRVGYCSVAGNTWVNTSPIPVGSFLDLRAHQPDTDPHYVGATPALWLEGAGLSCDPPTGYRATGDTIGYGGLGSQGPYPYYRRTS